MAGCGGRGAPACARRSGRNEEASVAVVEPRLVRQLAFLLELDRLKGVLRQSLLLDSSRRENDAEHSWHLALMALVLAEYAAEPVDLAHAVQLVLVHDIVEIDAGDTYLYDEVGARDKEAREAAAADRIFGLLPGDQGLALRALWAEFEARTTAEARFAAALDRLQPLLHNFHTEDASWKAHGVTRDQVLAKCQGIASGSPALWDYACELIATAVERGYLPV